MISGFLVVDKPAGITSHDVVGVLRAVTGVRRVGHTGTLDPFATGVLALAFGNATRLIQHLDESLKVYDAGLALGAGTDTGDLTGAVVAELPAPDADRARVEAVLAGLVGHHMQRPPAYSAVKVAGRPLYEYARRGETVEVAPRPIHIEALELTALDLPRLDVTMRCSRGTYARVVAEEIAAALGTVGHLAALRRLRSGPFTLEGAIGFDELGAVVGGPDLPWTDVLMPRRAGRAERPPWRSRDEVVAALAPRVWTPLAALSHLPQVVVGVDEAAGVRHGRPPAASPEGATRWTIVHEGALIAVGERTPRGSGLACVLDAR